jgi:hypothetical protein
MGLPTTSYAISGIMNKDWWYDKRNNNKTSATSNE